MSWPRQKIEGQNSHNIRLIVSKMIVTISDFFVTKMIVTISVLYCVNCGNSQSTHAELLTKAGGYPRVAAGVQLRIIRGKDKSNTVFLIPSVSKHV